MQHEKYSLSWKVFQKHLQETHRELYNEKHFADVTLVSDDMVPVKAHKTILCSASSVFKKLLMMNSGFTNQVLFLKGIDHLELESILQFIYLGETKVYENRIDLFVSASDDLDIKEFNQKHGAPLNETLEEEKETISNKSTNSNDNTINHTDDIYTVLKMDKKSSKNEEGSNDYPVNQANHEIQSSTQCYECNQTFGRSSALRYHQKTVHGEENFQCKQCQRIFSSKHNILRHVQAVHSGTRYFCEICEKSYSQKGHLSDHKRKHHQDA